MNLVPISFREARAFIGLYHRHNLPPKGWKFGVGLEVEERRLVGVGVAGQPVARLLNDGSTIEITRVCTTGLTNANSMLYGALTRASFALGYLRVVTYTLARESGSSLRGAGFVAVAECKPTGWERPNRPRFDSDLFGNERTPQEPKIRWERCAA